jgi:hypothetical protein
MDLTKIPRGRPVRGARALALYLLEDEKAEAVVRALPRERFGIQILAGQLVGYSGWLDAALVERATAGERTRRGRGAHRVAATKSEDGEAA